MIWKRDHNNPVSKDAILVFPCGDDRGGLERPLVAPGGARGAGGGAAARARLVPAAGLVLGHGLLALEQGLDRRLPEYLNGTPLTVEARVVGRYSVISRPPRCSCFCESGCKPRPLNRRGALTSPEARAGCI